jgi:hypothetical protein
MPLWTAPPGDVELPRLDELPRRMLAGESADDLALDFHDLVEHEPPTAQDAATGNHLGSRIDPADDFDNGDDLLYLPGAGRPRTATPSSTMAAAQELATALRDWGVKVSIELRTDAQGSWRVNRFVRNLAHHTVSRPSNGMTPCLSLCKYGRSDLSGPLCNGYGGYDMVARIITMGYANHSGLGGPWSVPGWGTVPRDDGRPYIFGWEFEGGYPESWTGVHERMHDFMARCNGATLEWIGAPLSCSGEHKTWAPTRKIDRLNYTTESGRAKIAAVSRAPEDDFMSALSDAEQKRLLENVDKLADNNVNGQTIFGAMRDVHDRVVTRKYDRMTPETEDDQTLPGTIRYMDKRLRDVEDNVKAILAAVQALQPPA